MRNRLTDWLQGEPIPRELHARVMGDPRLATRGGSAFSSRLALATAALVLVVVGGGLGSILLRGGTHPTGGVATVPSSPSASPSAAPSPQASPSPEPATSPSDSPTPATVPHGPGPSPSPVCQTSDLSLSLGSTQGAAGTIYQVVDATNHTTAPCQLGGYFGLALLDTSGRQVGPTPVRDQTGAGPGPAGTLELAPGGKAHFTFHWSDVQSTPQPCPTASQLELTAPNQYDHAFIAAKPSDGMTIAPCGSAPVGVGPTVAG